MPVELSKLTATAPTFQCVGQNSFRRLAVRAQALESIGNDEKEHFSMRSTPVNFRRLIMS
jgi:hypothetical protein